MLSKEEITNGLYHYSPNKGAAILFAVLYGVSFLIHEEQYRMFQPQKFTAPLWLGSLFSTIGFIIRALSATHIGEPKTAWRLSMMFILGAGPTYAGADYFICSRLFAYLPSAARISPLRTLRTFLAIDFLAEVTVWVGSGLAGAGSSSTSKATVGLNLIRVAMIVQLSLFVCFFVVVAMFHIRATSRMYGISRKDGPETSRARAWMRIVHTLYASSTFIGLRSAFHIAAYFLPESHAFTQKEAPFLCLEGLVMLLNTAMFNIFHPGTLLPADSRVILLPDGREVEDDNAKGAFEDSRSLMRKIVDPLDFGGLFKPSKQDPVHVLYTRRSGRDQYNLVRHGHHMP